MFHSAAFQIKSDVQKNKNQSFEIEQVHRDTLVEQSQTEW